MWSLLFISVLMLGSPGAADPKADVTALERPVSVLSPPISAIKGDPRATATVPPMIPNNWRAIQSPLARGMIPARIAPGSPLRFDDAALPRFSPSFDPGRFDADAREYMFFLYGGSSMLAGQVEADRLALEAAKDKRNRALIEASNGLNAALKQPGADRKSLTAAYENQRSTIRAEFETERARILGIK